MNLKLVRASLGDADRLWKLQVEAFQHLYAKYQDTDTSPATEKLEKIIARLEQPFTFYYFIQDEDIVVGAIRVVDHQNGGTKRISPIFILNEYRNKGYAQQAMRQAEAIHGNADWSLDTILQEKGNCYLYEKMGYRQTGKTEVINERMTLVFYHKQ